jgi:hypothetical protein
MLDFDTQRDRDLRSRMARVVDVQICQRTCVGNLGGVLGLAGGKYHPRRTRQLPVRNGAATNGTASSISRSVYPIDGGATA